MLKIGLTGGLASGKSFVGEALASYGCLVVEADELGHQALEAGGEAHDAVIREFGAGSSVKRARSTGSGWRKLFSPVARNWRASTRWCIRRWCAARRKWRRNSPGAKPDGIFVVEAAILIETGSYQRFDRLILVICTEEQQVERAMRREGAVEAVVRARLSRQMPVDDKRKFAISS